MTKQIALFGGSFNPPHIGHTLAIIWALSQRVDKVLVVPAFKHEFGKDLAPFQHRVEMCRLAFGWLPNVVISTAEQALGHSRTFDTICHLYNVEGRSNIQLRLLIGTDILEQKDQWYKWEEVEKLAPPIVLGRIGYPKRGVHNYLPDVSSSCIRQMLVNRESTDEVLHPDVYRYIKEWRLYIA